MNVSEIIERYPILSKEDFGEYSDGKKSFVVIENSGRDKLQSKYGIYPKYTIPYYGESGHAVIKAEWHNGEIQYEQFGSVNPLTSDFPYFVEVAQKRALDRLVRQVLHLGSDTIGRDELSSGIVSVSEGKTKVSSVSEIVADRIIKGKESRSVNKSVSK